MAARILGSTYELSLVFVGAKKGRLINKATRKKTYVPDVLSFPLSESAGEIVIVLPKAYADAPRYQHDPIEHVAFLFIHGCLHLAGYTHGENMEIAERRHLAYYASEQNKL